MKQIYLILILMVITIFFSYNLHAQEVIPDTSEIEEIEVDSSEIDTSDIEIEQDKDDETIIDEDEESIESDNLELDTDINNDENEIEEIPENLDEGEYEEVEEKPWLIEPSLLFNSRQIRKGADMSKDEATLQPGIFIFHEIGIYSIIDATRSLGKDNKFQFWSFGLGYSYSITDWFDVGLGYSFTKYANDSLNPLAGNSNMLSLGVDFDLDLATIDITLEKYFGSDDINYLSLGLYNTFSIGSFDLAPSAGGSLVTYKINVKRLKIDSGKLKLTDKTLKKSGLSSAYLSLRLTYNFGGGFSVDLTPNFVYSPIKDVSSKTTQFTFSVGLNYSFEF